MSDAASRILSMCVDSGFALAGVCASGASERESEYRQWIADGRHGSMEYLARDIATRMNPESLLEGARLAVIVADLYKSRRREPEPTPLNGHARVARYAQGDDYHEVMKRRLHSLADELRVMFAGHEFKAFVDTTPILERELAQRAGLGWIGKHTLLISPRLGSYLLLGGLLTTLDLAGTRAPKQVTDHCGSCTRCIDACPSAAISPYSVDASRCISYLTIERREEIPEEFHAAIGDWIFGCDICQDVCPHNSPNGFGSATRKAPVRSDVRAEYTPRALSLDPTGVLAWSAADRARELRGSSMKRARLDMMKRNAAIVLANLTIEGRHEASRALPLLDRLANDADEPPLARDAARQSASRIRASIAGDQNLESNTL